MVVALSAMVTTTSAPALRAEIISAVMSGWAREICPSYTTSYPAGFAAFFTPSARSGQTATSRQKRSATFRLSDRDVKGRMWAQLAPAGAPGPTWKIMGLESTTLEHPQVPMIGTCFSSAYLTYACSVVGAWVA